MEEETVRHPKSRKRPAADSVKHRLDRAEAMLCEFARHACDLLRIIRRDYKSPMGPGGSWISKWALSSVEKLLKDIAETIRNDPHQYTWKSVLLFPGCASRIDWHELLMRVARGDVDVHVADDGELMWRDVSGSRKP